jgi:hypothetical protein
VKRLYCLIYALLVLVVACATLPVPEALTVARQQEALQTNERVKELAPQEFAHAVQLRERADTAYDDGDRASAEILAEHALAAFQHAGVQARMARARERIEQGRAQLLATESELVRVTEAQQATEARAKALELRVRVVRDAEPLEPVGVAAPARENARREAATSILEVARLLCLSARMLDSEQEDANRHAQQVDELERELAAHDGPAAIDRAMTLRAQCLRSLTLTRREARTTAPETDPADLLLVQLKRALPEQFPIRDDRGVVIESSAIFDGKRTVLSETGVQLTQSLAAVAKANPAFPLLVVLHGPEALAEARIQSLSQSLSQAGAGAARIHSAGRRVPSSIAPVKGSPVADSRVEFVLVSPQ